MVTFFKHFIYEPTQDNESYLCCLISCVCEDRYGFIPASWLLSTLGDLLSVFGITLFVQSLNSDLPTAHSLTLHSNTERQNVTLSQRHTHTHTARPT